MALKLDMSKAHDIVEWEFVEAMLCKLGFAQSYVDLCNPLKQSNTVSRLMVNTQKR
jgi:hypothetical protein